MHEVGLAFDIVAMAVDFAERNDCHDISRIELQVGECCGVIPEALELGFSSARKDTIARCAELDICIVPGVVRCTRCGGKRSADRFLEPCSACGSDAREIISGREFRLVSIDAR